MGAFEEIAQTIIDDTIKNAIYIDDEIPSMFSEEEDKEGNCGPLYNSFQLKNCSLDFHKFKKREDWCNQDKLIFERKDLLILDWELSSADPKYLPTLEIIDKAVSTDNMHFVCIYTQTGEDITDIFYKILAFYSQNQTEQAIKDLKDIKDFLEDLGEDSDSILEALKGPLKETTLNQLSLRELTSLITQKIGGKQVGTFRQLVKKRFLSNRSFCDLSKFGFILNNERNYKPNTQDVYINVDINKNYLQINNTLISVFKKKETNAEILYDQFKLAVINANENFLTLMSLDLRNKVFRHSAFIGKELSTINESAFFHHMENAKPETSFDEFLIELWKNYNTNFLYTEKPALLKVLNEYKELKAKKDTPNIKDLISLNYHYNIKYSQPENRGIGFGDIFSVNVKKTEYFLLCITPHCDCLRPDKINGFYYFVKGQKYDLEKGLALAESGFVSFVRSGYGEVICIKWGTKPFTLYLCDGQRTINTAKKILYGEDFIDLKFHETIKENYAQRIANKSFSYPMRVGISFVEKELDTACEKYHNCPHIDKDE